MLRDLADVLETLARRAEALDPETAAIVDDAKARSLECRTLLVEQIDGLDSYARRVDDLSDRLYREALKSRMRPFGDCAQGLPRMVRDLSQECRSRPTQSRVRLSFEWHRGGFQGKA